VKTIKSLKHHYFISFQLRIRLAKESEECLKMNENVAKTAILNSKDR
jgi:hypothetical protein